MNEHESHSKWFSKPYPTFEQCQIAAKPDGFFQVFAIFRTPDAEYVWTEMRMTADMYNMPGLGLWNAAKPIMQWTGMQMVAYTVPPLGNWCMIEEAQS